MTLDGCKLWVTAALAVTVVSGCTESPFDFGQPRNCEIPTQNEWVYDVMQEVYLWSDELPEVDPTSFESPKALVTELRYPERDRWSRVSDKVTTQALFQEGKVISLGFGTRREPDGTIRIASVHGKSPAGAAGIQRGDELVSVSGLRIAQIDEQDLWGEVYGAKEPGVPVDVEIASVGTEPRPVQLVKDWVEIETVPHYAVHHMGPLPVGYLIFSTFVDTAYEPLDDAFAAFKAAGVHDVVVDLRYNGGGRIAVARHIIDLLVGDEADGEVSYQVQYSPALSDLNTSRDVSRTDESLRGVNSVTFITTGSTLSASELVINGVTPYTKVHVVGAKTGGKPVGSRTIEFCDSVLSPITFRLVNGADFGDYFGGFTPTCTATDDFDHVLGDPAEASLEQALTLAAGGDCFPPPPEPPDRDPPEALVPGDAERRAWYPGPIEGMPGMF